MNTKIISSCPSIFAAAGFPEISTVPAGKPPKLRFRPGNQVQIKGEVFLVLVAYRREASPHVWRFVLERSAEVGLVPAIVCPIIWQPLVAEEEIHDLLARIPPCGKRIKMTTSEILRGSRL
jgi:hypothetical protein